MSLLAGSDAADSKAVLREEQHWSLIYKDYLSIKQELEINSLDDREVVRIRADEWDSRLARAERRFVGKSNLDPAYRVQDKRWCPEYNLVDRPTSMHRDSGSLESCTDDTMYQSDNAVIEYTLDELDECWLQLGNTDMKFKGHEVMTCDFAEYVLDRFEKMWFNLTQSAQRWCIRKLESGAPREFRCDICKTVETFSSNIIVLCENCDLAVHQECYGVPLIPEGSWLCRKCHVGQPNAQCALCPWPGGAVKPTTDPDRPWCHVICANMLQNEVYYLNLTYKEPVIIKAIDPGRWHLSCQICKIKRGAPAQCAVSSCHHAVHAMCAQHIGCNVDYGNHTIRCWKHSVSHEEMALEARAHHNRTPQISEDVINNYRTGNMRKAKLKTFYEPTLPAHITDSLLESIIQEDRYNSKYLTFTIGKLARYWSLKRSYRHGVPLIKRLQIESWHSGGSIAEYKKKVKEGTRILKELKGLECAFEMIHAHERFELSKKLVLLEALQLIRCPLKLFLLTACSVLRSFDKHSFFIWPVQKEQVPDYYDVIKTPISISQIIRKLEDDAYESIQEFEDDVHLISENAMTYNQQDTIYFAAAQEFRLSANPFLKQIRTLLGNLNIFNSQSVLPQKFYLEFFNN